MNRGQAGRLVVEMEQRRRFWLNAILKGWQEVVDLKDHLEVGILQAGAVLVIIGMTLPFAGQWVTVAVAFVIVLFIVLEGAFLEWRDSLRAGASQLLAGLPDITVTPNVSSRNLRYLSVENHGAPAWFQAQIDIVGGFDGWFDGDIFCKPALQRPVGRP